MLYIKRIRFANEAEKQQLEQAMRRFAVQYHSNCAFRLHLSNARVGHN
jgi:hypothetical protein